MEYNFRQCYLYGDDWDGKLINIPDSAVFYNYYNLSEKQQEWYVMIPEKDFNEEWEGNGCCQVHDYDFFDWKIIHLRNIKPLEEWPNVGTKKFEELFNDFFGNCYMEEYTPGKYEVVSWDALSDGTIDFKTIEEPRICAVHRFKGIDEDACLKVTRVVCYNILTKREEYAVIESTVQLYDIQEGAYDCFHLKKKLTKSCLTYERVFNDVVNHLR